MKTKLTDKETLFCTYYCIGRNGREAAAKSGYVFPERTAAKLLRRKEIISFIKKYDKAHKNETLSIAAGYRRLAFGCIADAVSLLFDEEITKEKIEGMDLFNVSEIKRQKGGALEIKFFDRLKALEKLEANFEKTGDENENSLYAAIRKSAASLSEADDE